MLGREICRHHVGILVGCRRLIEGAQAHWQSGLQRRVNLLGGVGARVLVEVLQQVARVLGEHVDRTGLDLGHVDLALADPQLALHRESGPFEGLGVGLGDDLVRVVVLRADDDRRCIHVRAPLERLDRPAGGEGERSGREGGRQCQCAPHRSSSVGVSLASGWVRSRR